MQSLSPENSGYPYPSGSQGGGQNQPGSLTYHQPGSANFNQLGSSPRHQQTSPMSAYSMMSKTPVPSSNNDDDSRYSRYNPSRNQALFQKNGTNRDDDRGWYSPSYEDNNPYTRTPSESNYQMPR